VELLETIGHTSLKTMPRPKKVVDYIAKKVKNIADVSCEHTVLDMLASLRQDTQDKPIAVHYLM
jgi:tRNA A22 N-methylase